MIVEYRTGDLFEQGFTALAQGVNCRGVMGAGIAKEFRRRWPAMHSRYRHLCAHYRLQLGEIMRWDGRDGTVVYNLASQDLPGPYASLDAIRQAVNAMLDDAQASHITEIGLPRIGAGIGGLAWADVASALEDAAGVSGVHLVVVSLPGA